MQSERIFLVRTDKIGDVILTTPAIAALRKKLPDAYLVGVVSSVAAEIYLSNPHLNEVVVLDPKEYSGILGFIRFVSRLRELKCTKAVVFQTKFSVAFALWLSGAKARIGPWSKWWSWLFFNFGRRQSRSAVEMHEADYNIQLLRDFGITVAETREKTYLQVKDEMRREATRFFVEKGLSKKFKTVAIHPGMAGSALNWPESHYINLGRQLAKKYNLIITGGPQEAPLVERVFQGIGRNQKFQPDNPVFTKYVGEKGLAELIAILDLCDGIVAPSTGPMHLAVALGKKVITVFSPIKVQSAIRWGPYGVANGTNLGISPQDQASVLVPDVNCAEDFRCALSACIYYPCMPRISVEDVLTQLMALVEGGSVSMFKVNTFVGYDIEEEDSYEEAD